MATIPTKPITEVAAVPSEGTTTWPQWRSAPLSGQPTFHPDGSPRPDPSEQRLSQEDPSQEHPGQEHPGQEHPGQERRDEEHCLRSAGGDALQALLAFSALHQQVRRRRALAARHNGFEVLPRPTEFDPSEQFVLDDVLQLVARRAVAITGADGLGIALAENNEIVLRASAGIIKPDVGARIERDSAFSGACFRTAQIIRCDDTETDDRVNLDACRKLGARSMVAVPLCGRSRVIGLLEAFSAEPFGFNDSDVGNLELLAELILGALKPEDEDRFAKSAVVAETELSTSNIPPPLAEPTQAESLRTKAIEEIPAPEVSPIQPEAIQPQAQSKPQLEPLHLENVGATKGLTEKLDPEKVPSNTLRLAPQLVDAASIASSIAAVAAPAAAAPDIEANHLPEPSPSAEVAAEPAAVRHPGMLLVLVLIVVCVLLAGGLWWKLKNAQLGSMLVKSEPQMSAKPTANQTSTPFAPPSASTENPQVNGQTPNQQTLNESPSSAANSGIAENENSPAAGTATPRGPGKLPRITGIRHWSAADSSTVVLDLEDQVQYEEHRLANPDRIYFDLHDTTLAPDLEGKTIEIGDALLIRVRVAQPVSGSTRVVLETRGNSNFSVSLEPNPYRLVVQVRKQGVNTTSQVSLFPGSAAEDKEKLAIVVPPPTHEDLLLRARVPRMRIVVDAGHGGWDLGTVGRRGLLEKDVVLEIAQRLAKLLETRLGAEVILTRKDDNYIPLDERAGIANQAQADLFVSVHANYSDLPSARGVETYYTNFFSAPNSKEIETRPNGPANKNPVTAALSPADLHERIEQSRRLAASVQRSLYGTLSVQNPGLRDRGVKEASYVVLTETAMPGILAEVSFVSSPADEQKLRSDGYREQIAEALYKGIARYAAAGSLHVKMASAAK